MNSKDISINWDEHRRYVQKGAHAPLSPSQYAWANRPGDLEYLRNKWERLKAAERGTKDHEFASLCIQRGQRLPKSSKTLNLYVNDCVGYRMRPEQLLYYGPHCFGTTDAIAFNGSLLRISDLKTGQSGTKFTQLEVYAALFCLEHKVSPLEIDILLTIYQYDDKIQDKADVSHILELMDWIVQASSYFNKWDEEAD